MIKMKYLKYIMVLFLFVACDSREEMSIEPLKQYALNYFPCTGEEKRMYEKKVGSECMQFILYKLPKDVELIVKNRIIDEEFIIYNSLIGARLYSLQLKEASQSYRISLDHPVWSALDEYSNIPSSDEFESTAIIECWLEDKMNYRRHPLLNIEWKKIQKERHRINLWTQ